MNSFLEVSGLQPTASFFSLNFEVAHTVLVLRKTFSSDFLAHGKMEITIVVHRWRADLATSLQCALMYVTVYCVTTLYLIRLTRTLKLDHFSRQAELEPQQQKAI